MSDSIESLSLVNVNEELNPERLAALLRPQMQRILLDKETPETILVGGHPVVYTYSGEAYKAMVDLIGSYQEKFVDPEDTIKVLKSSLAELSEYNEENKEFSRRLSRALEAYEALDSSY